MRMCFLLAAAGLAGACDQADPVTGPLAGEGKTIPPPPAALTTIPVGAGTARIWSYVTDDLQTEKDPVNLVFTGKADPRAIRNALLGLDGNRAPVFPPVFPFTCTWSDAIGDLMEGFEESTGWAGGAVQLQCGDYGPLRFHFRLFKTGDFTIGNVHFEMVIPGTADHQVLSWELAEQLVAYDMIRTGLLGAAPASTGPINAAPSHRTIPGVIYNGLPGELVDLIGGPATPVAEDVPIITDGQATILSVAGEAPSAAPQAQQDLVINYDQVIPKPFCASGPADFVYVSGPVSLHLEVFTSGSELRRIFRASGELTVIPIDIGTGEPAGPAMQALVSENQDARAGSRGGTVIGLQFRELLPASQAGTGQLKIQVNVGPGRAPRYDRQVICH
ncbi:MAG TPA: hypothetical protein VI383_11655 [Gemmatimonadales bacterium]|nr:hypothetical protein [Gemmatimonadales bacterium]